MNKYLLIPVMAILALNVWLAIPALATEQRNQDAVVAEHKIDNSSTDDDAYYDSEQYKVGKWANESLKRIKGGDL